MSLAVQSEADELPAPFDDPIELVSDGPGTPVGRSGARGHGGHRGHG